MKRFAAALVFLSIGLPVFAQDPFLKVEQIAGPFAAPTQVMKLFLRSSALAVAPEQEGFYHKDYKPGLEIPIHQITSVEYLPENRYTSCSFTISWEDRGVEQQDEFTVPPKRCTATASVLRSFAAELWVAPDK